MKTWLKGGLIGEGIFFLMLILSILIGIILNINPIKSLIPLIAYPCYFYFTGGEGMGCIVIGPVINIILSFIIGTIIGLIIQKLRK